MDTSELLQLCSDIGNPLTAAMGYLELGQPEKALEHLQRANKLRLELLGELSRKEKAES